MELWFTTQLTLSRTIMNGEDMHPLNLVVLYTGLVLFTFMHFQQTFTYACRVMYPLT